MAFPQASPPPNTGPYATETEALSATVRKLALTLDPLEIWLFGSRARGTHRPDSDFDIMVVMREKERDGGSDHRRAYEPLLGSGVGVDVVPYASDIFPEAFKDRSTIAYTAVNEGYRIYGAGENGSTPQAHGRGAAGRDLPR